MKYGELRRRIVRCIHKNAVCVKSKGKVLYSVLEKPGGKVIARAYSAVQAWKNALNKLSS